MNLSLALTSVEDFYRRIYWQAPAAITQSTPTYTLSYSGISWLYSVNQLWLHRIDALNDQLLHQTAAFFQPRGAEYSIVFTVEAPLAVASWLADRHFTERISSPIYALCGPPRLTHPIHRTARIVRVTAEHHSGMLQVLYSAFFIGPEVGRSIIRPEHFTDPTIRHYLAYIDDEPAACVTVLLHDHVAGVWNVGTMRAFRRQGLASTVLAYALTEAAAHGCPNSVLVSSAMGRSLYEKMGYQLIGTTYHYGPLD